jgi:hypothetical protein
LELLLIAFLLPAALTATIVYGKGYTRAFCIGALIPAGALCLWSAAALFSDFSLSFDLSGAYVSESFMRQLQCAFGGAWLATILSGSLCVGLRWLLQRPAAGDGSAQRHRWGGAVFGALLFLLVLSGPIVGRIGISAGWWAPGAPSDPTALPFYRAAPAPTISSAPNTSPPPNSTPYPPVAGRPSGPEGVDPPSPIEPAGTK